ncbi:unnamed protein product [Haemonchus placei]|uniref:COesterase domain-containing protein n=1 Tax=Haemonchus placei TaxID=6290 RepID=A0A158QRF8_HAEPC|nr:unnamed protein product [Haemonchus placei]
MLNPDSQCPLTVQLTAVPLVTNLASRYSVFLFAKAIEVLPTAGQNLPPDEIGDSPQVLEKSRSVWVEQGLVRGKIYNIDGRHIQIFRGIPYAEPPLGNLRFAKPVKKSRWHQELSAVEYGPPCIQFMDFHRYDKFSAENMKRQSEDCLYLNVFSPYDNEDESKTFPIIVWIHGGSFLAGSADTGIDMEVGVEKGFFECTTHSTNKLY